MGFCVAICLLSFVFFALDKNFFVACSDSTPISEEALESILLIYQGLEQRSDINLELNAERFYAALYLRALLNEDMSNEKKEMLYNKTGSYQSMINLMVNQHDRYQMMLTLKDDEKISDVLWKFLAENGDEEAKKILILGQLYKDLLNFISKKGEDTELQKKMLEKMNSLYSIEAKQELFLLARQIYTTNPSVKNNLTEFQKQRLIALKQCIPLFLLSIDNENEGLALLFHAFHEYFGIPSKMFQDNTENRELLFHYLKKIIEENSKDFHEIIDNGMTHTTTANLNSNEPYAMTP